MKLSTSVTRALLTSLLLALVTSPASAMCPHPVPKACSWFFMHDTVFVGRVLSSDYVGAELDAIRFRIAVERVLRGTVGRVAVVYTGNDSGRVTWEVGHTYVMFAQHKRGKLEATDDCGTLSDPAEVASTVGAIEDLAKQTDAVVGGHVLESVTSGAPIHGLKVHAKGFGREFASTTDAQGRFTFHVPPGRYGISVDGAFPVPSVYSYGTFPNVTLAAGQCAQFELVTGIR